MLLSPRTYLLAQTPDGGSGGGSGALLGHATGWQESKTLQQHTKKMLLLQQTASVKVGEVVRYTITYTPSLDRILPAPPTLHVKIKNTSAIPLRAAYLRGPYTLHVAAYPSTFHPNRKVERPHRDGVPQYEPQLKAGGVWTAVLTVPEDIRTPAASSAATSPTSPRAPIKSATWIVEISSQIIFSASAAVHFELLVGRDERSLETGIINVASATRGRVEDHQQSHETKHTHHPAQPKGIFSKAIKLVVDDTASLWNEPPLPRWEDRGVTDSQRKQEEAQKPVHLVILTHGMHSNIGADMLYLKESIDEGAKQAREDARLTRARSREQAQPADPNPSTPQGDTMTADQVGHGGHDDHEVEDEQVIVRGFTDNAVRTEKGIKYLGKRLARYVLALTYPQQPVVEVKESTRTALKRTLTGARSRQESSGEAVHAHSSLHKVETPVERRAYRITSISFVGHSLGGLIQTYAVAYIQKHAPSFFHDIHPINFIALATPFLGLSNENPIYVKFALDSGLVGRTGKDLGLTWRAPTLARVGWDAVVGGLGSATGKNDNSQTPPAKPLLRILPTGPAHVALKGFRNRTVYSNVVNDGIVPLRTSCLLFLDWTGLGRVEKARRENGIVGTVAGWGWAELTGANTTPRRAQSPLLDRPVEEDVTGDATEHRRGSHRDTEVPQPPAGATDDDAVSIVRAGSDERPRRRSDVLSDEDVRYGKDTASYELPHALSTLFHFLRPSHGQGHQDSVKPSKQFSRGQTTSSASEDPSPAARSPSSVSRSPERLPIGGKRPSIPGDDGSVDEAINPHAPPKTTIFESAGDILNPPLPPTEFLIDPTSRPRSIFHDRVYHPEDIPPAPIKQRRTGLGRSGSISDRDVSPSGSSQTSAEVGGMKVEEKIARAYHRDLSWRKVLVRLEPDAHNNMIVRRMFANAYGWPVVKHLVDTHFADTYTAKTRDDDEPGVERAKGMEKGVTKHGNEVRPPPHHGRSQSELRELDDEVGEMGPPPRKGSGLDIGGTHSARHMPARQDSAQWSDAAFDVTDDDTDDEGGDDDRDDDDGDDESTGGSSRRGSTTLWLASSSHAKEKEREREKEMAEKAGESKKLTTPQVADFVTASPATTSASQQDGIRRGKEKKDTGQ
ncbi:MAG: hypothetical protein M1838_003386 [Thelocarpon superellum]|nr:MAG: hypothetical protein M1838_003386 [Thelocarpon superellum]